MRVDSPAARIIPAIMWFAEPWGRDRRGREHCGRGVTAGGNHLGHDRYGDFFRRQRPDIEANWKGDTLHASPPQPFALEYFTNLDKLALAANHADISRPGRDGPAQAIEVPFVPAGRKDEVGVMS